MGRYTGQGWLVGITLWNAGQSKVVGRYTEGVGMWTENQDLDVDIKPGPHGICILRAANKPMRHKRAEADGQVTRHSEHCYRKWRWESCLVYCYAQLGLGQLRVAAGTLVCMHVELKRVSGEQQPG